MLVKKFNYFLPKKLIAQKPVRPRDCSRLLVLEKTTGKISHHKFFELPRLLQGHEVLVFNNSKVIPARLYGYKKETGGKIEIFLLREIKRGLWQCLIKGKGKFWGQTVNFFTNKKRVVIQAKLLQDNYDGTWQVKFNQSEQDFKKIINLIGCPPTPPYIKRMVNLKEYQTIYAKVSGSVAAPTAGLHFTNRLLRQLKERGIQLEFITLHVGFGTFQPVKVAKIEQHQLHPEWASLSPQTAKRLNVAKKTGRRIIAVGTTVVRTLETFSKKSGRLKAGSRWIKTFIYPSYKFRFVDALITNFHLPKSTLLMLVCALAGRKNIFRAYRTALAKKYRFFSFGDAMLIK